MSELVDTIIDKYKKEDEPTLEDKLNDLSSKVSSLTNVISRITEQLENVLVLQAHQIDEFTQFKNDIAYAILNISNVNSIVENINAKANDNVIYQTRIEDSVDDAKQQISTLTNDLMQLKEDISTLRTFKQIQNQSYWERQ